MFTVVPLLLLVWPSCEVQIDHGGRRTRGVVVHSSAEHGTWILTTKHGHESSGPWTASGGLSGRAKLVDKNADLCLLWCRQTSHVVTSARVVAALPSTHVSAGKLRGRAFRHGLPGLGGIPDRHGHGLVSLAGELSVGSSGCGLFDGHGRLCGICVGRSLGATCFAPAATIDRFLRSVVDRQ